MKEEHFEVKLTETKVTTKIIKLKKEDDIQTLKEAELYVKDAMDNFGFDELTRYPSVEDEYELTYNGKQEWELEDE